jgi:protein disulfide-isomerase A1
MDITENDVLFSFEQRVEGFPAIKLYKAVDNSVVDYQGDKTLADLADFVKRNAFHSNELSDISVEDPE